MRLSEYSNIKKVKCDLAPRRRRGIKKNSWEMIYDRSLVCLCVERLTLGVALYSFQSLSAMELTIKVLHCDGDIIESETVMTFLADEKVSENETIVISWMVLLI